jgi:hypothetical protein
MHRSLTTALLAAAALALPAATAAAADTVVAPDPVAQQITALDGTIAWVTGKFGHQNLMQRTPDGTISKVKGTREARAYRSIDLGHDQDGALRLTYLRCDGDATSSCQALWNDLDGRRATFRRLTIPGCSVGTAPSWWRTKIAYGLECTGSAKNRKLTGLYVKTGSHGPVRLPRPRDAVKFGVTRVGSVDLRGTQVAATVNDIFEYSYSETTAGRNVRSFLAAASEGDSDEHARGLAIQSAGTWWTLTNASHAGDPDESIVFRQTGACLQRERLVSADESGNFLATDVAADGASLYLLVPNVGIVSHAFTADPTLTC